MDNKVLEFEYLNRQVKQTAIEDPDYPDVCIFTYECDDNIFESAHKLDKYIDPKLVAKRKKKR